VRARGHFPTNKVNPPANRFQSASASFVIRLESNGYEKKKKGKKKKSGKREKGENMYSRKERYPKNGRKKTVVKDAKKERDKEHKEAS